MGHSWSANNISDDDTTTPDNNNNNFIPPPPLPPLQPLLIPPPPPPQGYFFPLPTPYAPPCANFVTPPPPLSLPPQPHSVFYSNPIGHPSYANPVVGHVQFNPYFTTPHGWFSPRPSSSSANSSLSNQPPPPPPYVNHQTTKKIRSHVNVHKGTLRFELDDLKPHHYLVSFVFDAVYDGSITIIYFANEEERCRFVPLFPDIFEPVRVPFQKGVGQKFVQPSGTGTDLSIFELDALTKSSPEEDAFPLIICAETCAIDETPGHSMPGAHPPPHMQITQCVLQRSNGGGAFQIKVVRQILWIDGVRYELRELYGIGSSGATDFDNSKPGKDCVICMIEPKDTAVLPCRHMCMCSECAKTLRLQSNKCPICRQSIEELIEIKMNNSYHQ
ncbi:probable E3 ubiquitin-protein ligase LUL4 [Lotus japonicus]|uniref:probable E3 ubiquitin-protein ligase LUL4 n=1 Tax=Lotus japonicus TaxID=34305 RepID=UPI002583143D|nr:probable E3 ubiquitin-protein ligase LUL4 [Lotus japonicus]